MMEQENKKGVGYKVQKNPFLLGLFVIVITVALFAISSLSTAIQERIRDKEAETAVSTTKVEKTTSVAETKPENQLNVGEFKKHAKSITSVAAAKEANRVAVTVCFEDEETLLQAHFANKLGDISVVPMFYFYINNGTTPVKCPGEIRLLSDGKSVVYYLSEISDFANAIGLADDVTVTLDNVLYNKFNICIEHKYTDGISKTIVGTYGQSVEQFNSLHGKEPAKVSKMAKGIKRVETTVTEEFVWVDIYYTDIEAYTRLNNDLINNFIKFKFEKGGKIYDGDFIISEHESVNMIRCKFDSYSLKPLAKEIDMKNITVEQLFTNYQISVFSSDYDRNTDLFTLN